MHLEVAFLHFMVVIMNSPLSSRVTVTVFLPSAIVTSLLFIHLLVTCTQTESRDMLQWLLSLIGDVTGLVSHVKRDTDHVEWRSRQLIQSYIFLRIPWENWREEEDWPKEKGFIQILTVQVSPVLSCSCQASPTSKQVSLTPPRVIICNITWHVTWCDVTWCDITWCNVTWCNFTWCNVTWCDVTWCNVTERWASTFSEH